MLKTEALLARGHGHSILILASSGVSGQDVPEITGRPEQGSTDVLPFT
ncbi:MAG: hypothetical protein ACYCRD_11240 [Leptospirillum sp.]